MTTPDTELRNLVRDAIFDEDYALSGLMSNEVLDAAIAEVLKACERKILNATEAGQRAPTSYFVAEIRALGTEKD